jgi:hypothetical protein
MQAGLQSAQVGSLVAEFGGPWAADLSVNGVGFSCLDGRSRGQRFADHGSTSSGRASDGAA